MLNEHQPVIVNAIGHLAGTIVFAIFLVLAFRSGAGRRPRESALSVASAVLALLWNAGSLITLIIPAGAPRSVIEAISFSSLSLLPAVLLHLSLGGKFRGIAASGYLLSAVASAMHILEHLEPALPLHKWALWTITAGFGALTLIYAAQLVRGRMETARRTSQIVASMCLLLFAVTFSHFGSGHPPQPWSKELLLHHAGIPVALLILLQDYRFVFLDAFVRFLANVILALILGLAGIRLAATLMPGKGASHPLAEALELAGLCGLLILFAYLRGIVQRWLTLAVFRRVSIEGAAQELRSKAAEIRNETEYLGWASARLAAYTGASRFQLFNPAAESELRFKDLSYPTLSNDAPWLRRNSRWNWAEAIVPIRLSQSDVRYLLLGRRRGGRRYLSEDLRLLNQLGTVVVEEVERSRAAEMQRLVSEAELRALHAQINPHFLFNALNTIYGVIPRGAAEARRTVLNLSDIFRYFLQSDKVLIPLSEELKIVRAYLEIERLRLGPRLTTVVRVDKDAEPIMIPVLSIQPLVENAIKHGLSTHSNEGWLRLTAQLLSDSLIVTVEDSGAEVTPDASRNLSSGNGIGLSNVTRRLQLCFGPDASVHMQHGAFGTRVQFSIPHAGVAAQIRS